MKLELKHLVGYLPYGLKIKILNHKCDYVGIEFSEVSGYYFLGDSLHVSYNGGYTGKSIDDFKPILRPLSDIFKSKHLLDKADDFCVEMIEQNKIECLPYGYIQLLLENHIDVFGLIPQGLAIDINNR